MPTKTFNAQALRDIFAHQSTRLLRRLKPSNSFKNWHWAYFLAACLLSSIIFWLSSAPQFSVSYINSLFMVISAMSLTGMNTVNLGELNTFQQSILYLLMILGNPITISLVVLSCAKTHSITNTKSLE
jgi:Trk-type K+ transport system membrane component